MTDRARLTTAGGVDTRAPIPFALYAILGGAVSFLGWSLDRQQFTDWLGTGVSIQPNSSVLITLAGAALLLLHSTVPWRREIATGLGVVIAVAGALIMSQYLTGADLGFNHQLLFGRTWGQSTTTTPGRVGPPASISFTLLGSALVILGRSSPHDRCRRHVSTLSLAVCTLMLFSVFGYLFGARQFFAIPGFSAIALQTASMILALSLGLVSAVPDQQPMRLLRERSGAGTLARLVLPALVVLPPLVILLRTQGTRLGYYDEGTSRALGAVALVVANLAIMWTALVILKRREERERASEARLRSLVGVITDVTWVADAAGAFAEPQREWEKYTGQPWDRHRNFGWLEAIHPDDREWIRAAWQNACASRTLYEARGRLWHEASRTWHHFVARATPLFDADGSVREWVGSYTDVNSQVLAEEALRSADRRKDEFLATLAHELRNPLAPVRNAAQILHLKGPQDPELRWAQGVIDRQMQHMSRLVDDLLDVSRISRGRIELKRERVELETILRGALEASRPLIEERGHTFELQLPSMPIYLNADLTRLAQVFSNLLNNAAKYTEPGGQIVMRAERTGSDVRVEVQDSGIGIPLEMRERIFELFEQVGTTLERAGGLGIGLTLVKRLVEMHGGAVEVRANPAGKGSVFSVRLPAETSSSTEADQRPVEAHAGVVLSRRVLIVDDNRDSADTMAVMLGATGCELQIAYDGAAAIDTANEFRPDVILLDIGLPRVSGYDVARAIRSTTWGSGVTLVALTGWGQEEDRRRSLEAGFDHHLVKPVAPGRLLALLSSSRAPGSGVVAQG